MATESASSHSADKQGPPASAYSEKRQPVRVSGPPARAVTAAARKVASPVNLGWLSIGLGAAALFAPGPVARMTGLRAQSRLLPLVGLRELASGLGLLTQQNSGPWLWSRVVGDAMDVAVIASALRSNNPLRTRAWGTLGVVAAIAAVDAGAAVTSSAQRRALSAGPFSESLIVNRTPQECYEFWREPGNLPRFSAALDAVAPIDEHHARWMLRGPLGNRLTLTIKSDTDESVRRIAWHSVRASDLAHAGVVRFDPAPGRRGTLVTASLWYRPPGGKPGVRLAKLIGADPHAQLREDLRRFRQLIETGEVATTRGQPSGRRSLLGRWSREGRQSRQRS